MAATRQQPEYVDETHRKIVEFAEEFIDDPAERKEFIDTLMERNGYQRINAWELPESRPRAGGSQRSPLLKPGR